MNGDGVMDKIMDVKYIDKLNLVVYNPPQPTYDRFEAKKREFITQWGSSQYQAEQLWNSKYPSFDVWKADQALHPQLNETELRKLQDKINEIIDLLVHIQRVR